MLREPSSLPAGVCEAFALVEADIPRLELDPVATAEETSWLRAFESAMAAILEIRQAAEMLVPAGTMPSVQEIVDARGTAPRHQAEVIIQALKAISP